MKKLRITVEGKTYEVTVEVLEDTDDWNAPLARPGISAHDAAGASRTPVEAEPVPVAAAPVAGQGDVVSPMSATVVSVLVREGQTVVAGQSLLVLEAMKMESNVSAPAGGKVTTIYVADGAVVSEGQPLVAIT